MMELQDTQDLNPVVQRLREEHALISKVLSAFENWSRGLLVEGGEDRLGLRRYLRFFVEFADGCHHLKEEQVLFKVMGRFGFGTASGPVPVMMDEHDHGRVLIQDLNRLAQQSPAWSQEDRREVCSLVTSYASLLRNHVDKENHFLYPMAESRLSSAAWSEIANACAAIDDELECAGALCEMEELTEQLLH